jgi:hypothetical protein
MRAQIFYLLEQNTSKGHSRSLPSIIDDEILARQGVVTFHTIDELYEQYMKSLADIRDTDRFIVELEETHANELKEITQREYHLKESLAQVHLKLDQTRTDCTIQSLAKQVLEREHTMNLSKFDVNTSQTQTDMNLNDIEQLQGHVDRLRVLSDDQRMQIHRMHDDYA